jgi:hypothetical protein
MALDYFRNLFQADPEVEAEALLNLTETRVSQEMNEQLCKEFTEKEIPDALFQMGPLKGRMVSLLDSTKDTGRPYVTM